VVLARSAVALHMWSFSSRTVITVMRNPAEADQLIVRTERPVSEAWSGSKVTADSSRYASSTHSTRVFCSVSPFRRDRSSMCSRWCSYYAVRCPELWFPGNLVGLSGPLPRANCQFVSPATNVPEMSSGRPTRAPREVGLAERPDDGHALPVNPISQNDYSAFAIPIVLGVLALLLNGLFLYAVITASVQGALRKHYLWTRKQNNRETQQRTSLVP
jgi:hypothetical protein